MANDKTFVAGIYSDKKTSTYGDFYTLGIGPKFIEFYNEHKNDKGYINVLFMENREGKPYMYLATPREGDAPAPAASTQSNADIVNEAARGDDLPF
jgi:hypothetical protein